MEPPHRTHLRAPSIVLVLASFAFRLPPLLNARSTNSDAAVVGLQAMHVLRGEIEPFLWGSGYQTAGDSFVATAWFAMMGPSPLALMLSALSLHVLATWLVFATLRRHVAPWTALFLTMPLIVTPSSVHTYALYPPRQASLTLAIAALWAIDAAAVAKTERRARLWLAAGGLCATLAVSADPYPLLLLPIASIFALLVAWDARTRGHAERAGAFALGAFVGILPFFLLRSLAGANRGPLTFTTSMLDHHFRLLWNECLPWALSYKVYYAHHVMDYLPWNAPLAFRVVGVLGAILLGALVLFGLVAIVLPYPGRPRTIPLPIRRLGFAGALTFPVAIGGFLVSVMVVDHFSMRYLAVLTLMIPFAVAPAASALGTRRFAVAFAPHLIASAIAGWVGYGPFVRGPLPVVETPELRDDYALFDLLAAHGITYAEADYWASYRLTFLSREHVIVVPTSAVDDRYAPYRRAFEQAPEFAYLFDPGRSRENLGAAERALAACNSRVEPHRVGNLTVFLVNRSAPAQ
ncbi:MAG: hypothetical protein FWD73_13360 [Polyangiaceae bacterium]|nr:hypothetical protein [Polyangiaceae bacterium]